MVAVRAAAAADAAGIRHVHLSAFETSLEADLVARLLSDGDAVASLVATDGEAIVGHVMLSRMEVEGDGRDYRAVGLAPVAVAPERQRQGIGTALVTDALRQAEAAGEEIVFLLGEPRYYRRFGFAPEAAAPFASPYAGPYFMAKAFVPLPQMGRAAYAPAFANLA